MRKLLLPLAVVLAFSFAAMAQAAGTSSTQTETQTTTKQTKKHAMHTKGGAAAEHQLTGCLAKDPSGGFSLTNGRYKKGVEVKSSQDLSAHVGHEVKLMGTWEKPTAGGEGGAGAQGKQMRTFTATNVTHISDTCSAGAAKGKGATKSKAETSSTQTTKK